MGTLTVKFKVELMSPSLTLKVITLLPVGAAQLASMRAVTTPSVFVRFETINPSGTLVVVTVNDAAGVSMSLMVAICVVLPNDP